MQDDNVIAYASRQLKAYEKNYPTHDMKLAQNSRGTTCMECRVRFTSTTKA